MNGTKLLADTAVFSAESEAREIAVSKLCNKNSTMAVKYVLKRLLEKYGLEDNADNTYIN